MVVAVKPIQKFELIMWQLIGVMSSLCMCVCVFFASKWSFSWINWLFQFKKKNGKRAIFFWMIFSCLMDWKQPHYLKQSDNNFYISIVIREQNSIDCLYNIIVVYVGCSICILCSIQLKLCNVLVHGKVGRFKKVRNTASDTYISMLFIYVIWLKTLL